MKKFIGYFRDFHKGYFNPVLYILTLLYIAALIVVNYKYNVENGFIDSFAGRPLRIVWFFLIHALGYYGVVVIIYLVDKSKLSIPKGFWWKSALGFLILATDRSIFPNLAGWLLDGFPYQTLRFYSKLLVNSYGLVTILGMLTVMKILFDRKEDYGIYGLRLQKVDFKAYSIMLMLMVPIIFAASFIPEFIKYYPLYKKAGGAAFASYYQINESVSKLLYEFFYLTDFLNTEVFFRGFLVIGLSKMLGKNVVLPMAATYAVLHFGKPLGETISSVFGGYILGVIALYSRNIWGGVFLHGGIAFLMEVFAFLRQ
jgi:hypothetical protein